MMKLNREEFEGCCEEWYVNRNKEKLLPSYCDFLYNLYVNNERRNDAKSFLDLIDSAVQRKKATMIKEAIEL